MGNQDRNLKAKNRNVNPDDPDNQRSRYGKATSVRNLGWGAADSAVVHECIAAVTACGDAILFSRTADGGALAYTIYSGDNQFKRWASDYADAEKQLGEDAAMARALASH